MIACPKTNFYVDGKNQDYGTCVRMSDDNQHATDPVRPISSENMACGVDVSSGADGN